MVKRTISNELKTSLHFLISILENGSQITPEGINALLEVKRGNKRVIKEHLKAIYNIIGKALKELEK